MKTLACLALVSSSASIDAFVPKASKSNVAFLRTSNAANSMELLATSSASSILEVPTKPIPGMKPGTSGLRKKVEVWQAIDPSNKHYVENFIQSLLDTATSKNGGKVPQTYVFEHFKSFGSLHDKNLLLIHYFFLCCVEKICRLIVAGDGRYYNNEAIPIIARVLAANGVTHIWIPTSGIMSTPAVSATIRTKSKGMCDGGIVLTASHNPGGPGEDFGIKYNLRYGQPAGEDFTDDVRCSLN